MRSIRFCWATMLLFYAVGCLMVCADLASVPVHDAAWARAHPEWRVQDVEYPVSTWGLSLGDGEVTAFENIFIWVPLFFGFMRMLDLLKLYRELEEAP